MPRACHRCTWLLASDTPRLWTGCFERATRPLWRHWRGPCHCTMLLLAGTSPASSSWLLPMAGEGPLPNWLLGRWCPGPQSERVLWRGLVGQGGGRVAELGPGRWSWAGAGCSAGGQQGGNFYNPEGLSFQLVHSTHTTSQPRASCGMDGVTGPPSGRSNAPRGSNVWQAEDRVRVTQAQKQAEPPNQRHPMSWHQGMRVQ